MLIGHVPLSVPFIAAEWAMERHPGREKYLLLGHLA